MTNTPVHWETSMSDFFEALLNPYAPFLIYALVIGAVSSVTFGIIGTYVVTKRISYIAGAISHSILGGLGAAIYFGIHPMIGAFIAAIASALIIGFASIYEKEREDTLIGAIWAIGMAVGLIFLSMTPGYSTSIMSYLFGSILLVSGQDIALIIALNSVILIICFVFFDRLLAVCFDEEIAKLRGVNVTFFYILLLVLISITIVLLIRIVGIIMVIALLTIPSATACYFSKKLSGIMIISVLFCFVFNITGIAISFIANTPSGPTIVVIAAFFYTIVVIMSHFMKNK